MRVNQIRSTCLIALLITCTSGMDLGCSVDLPDGKIYCDSAAHCPKDWTCTAGLCWKPGNTGATGQAASDNDSGTDAQGGGDSGVSGTDAQSSDSGVIGTDAQSSDTGGTSGCVPIDCEGKCGPIQGCEGTITCECKIGFQCASGTCVPVAPQCDGCNIDGTCYKANSANPQNPCQVCLKTSQGKWSPNPSKTKVKCGSKVAGKECTQDVYCDGEKCPLPHLPNGTKCNGAATQCEVQDVCENGECPDKGFRDGECTDANGKTGEAACYNKNKCVDGQCKSQPKEENATCIPEGNAGKSECIDYKCTRGSCNATYPGSSRSCTFQDANRQQCGGHCNVYGLCEAATDTGTCSTR